jgi:hypothetical protein
MSAFRYVVSVLLRALGDVSLHPQAAPCGRPLRGRPRSPNPGRRARPHRNTYRLHGLTGQWTHF